MFIVRGSQSTNTGLSPFCISGNTLVLQHTAGTSTSSPVLRYTLRSGLQATAMASRLADEPELTMHAYGAPTQRAKASSNSLTRGPRVS